MSLYDAVYVQTIIFQEDIGVNTVKFRDKLDDLYLI